MIVSRGQRENLLSCWCCRHGKHLFVQSRCGICSRQVKIGQRIAALFGSWCGNEFIRTLGKLRHGILTKGEARNQVKQRQYLHKDSLRPQF